MDNKAKPADFGASVDLEVVRVRAGDEIRQEQAVATEVPFTIKANDVELATMLCSPIDLEALAYGFLFTSGFIRSATDVHGCVIDRARWLAELAIERDPDPDIIGKRLYTSGCGKGVTYSSVLDVATRQAVASPLSITGAMIGGLAEWIQTASPLARKTGGLHTAGLSHQGEVPSAAIDDIGRHNAVDKVIGRGLLDGLAFSEAVLVCSGRVSSEILQKARRAGMPMVVARGAPTHQAVLRARDMGIAIVGFARGSGYTVYSHEARIRRHG